MNRPTKLQQDGPSCERITTRRDAAAQQPESERTGEPANWQLLGRVNDRMNEKDGP
jgi:hypothetical protein